MIIIGEKINSKTTIIKNAIEVGDSKIIQELAIRQYEAGASFIDISASSFKDEADKLTWLIDTIQEVIDVPFSIDSRNPHSVEGALKAIKKNKPIINCITFEEKRLKALMPLVSKYSSGVIALCSDDGGMPETIDDRLRIAEKLIQVLTKEGVNLKDIYLDPYVRAISSGAQAGLMSLEALKKFKLEFPEIHVVCGVSNISFGVPARKLMNQAFLVAAMTVGVDAAILDPLDSKLMSLLYATEAIIGKDEFSMNYQMKFREGALEF